MAGLEPATLLDWLPTNSNHLNYTAYRISLYIALYLRPSHARKPLPTFAIALSQPRNMGSRTIGACSQVIVKSFCLNPPITVAHSPDINSFNTFPSALHYYLPALLSTCRGQLVAVAGVGTYLYSLPVVLTDSNRLFPLHPFSWSLSMPFWVGRFLLIALRRYPSPYVSICQPTYRDCSLHVPLRLWRLWDSNRTYPLGNRFTVCRI